MKIRNVIVKSLVHVDVKKDKNVHVMNTNVNVENIVDVDMIKKVKKKKKISIKK